MSKATGLGLGMAIVLLSMETLLAGPDIRFEVSPVYAWNSGKTEYIMETFIAFGWIPVSIKSQLEFPLDASLAGGKVAMRASSAGRPNWTASATILKNISDPGGKVTDGDWFDIFEISYTESDATMSATVVDLEFRKHLPAKHAFCLGLVAAIKYQKIRQQVIGVEGWQLDSTLMPVSFSDTGLVGIYEVKYVLPQVGLAPSVRLNGKFLLEGKAAYTRAFISDFDDHVRRNKSAESEGQGNGFVSSCHLLYSFGEISAGGIFIDLGAEFLTLSADITQTQSWYGNDPIDDFNPDTGDPEIHDNTGEILVGIPHEIKSTQYSIGVRLGYAFR